MNNITRPRCPLCEHHQCSTLTSNAHTLFRRLLGLPLPMRLWCLNRTWPVSYLPTIPICLLPTICLLRSCCSFHWFSPERKSRQGRDMAIIVMQRTFDIRCLNHHVRSLLSPADLCLVHGDIADCGMVSSLQENGELMFHAFFPSFVRKKVSTS